MGIFSSLINLVDVMLGSKFLDSRRHCYLGIPKVMMLQRKLCAHLNRETGLTLLLLRSEGRMIGNGQPEPHDFTRHDMFGSAQEGTVF